MGRLGLCCLLEAPKEGLEQRNPTIITIIVITLSQLGHSQTRNLLAITEEEAVGLSILLLLLLSL